MTFLKETGRDPAAAGSVRLGAGGETYRRLSSRRLATVGRGRSVTNRRLENRRYVPAGIWQQRVDAQGRVFQPSVRSLPGLMLVLLLVCGLVSGCRSNRKQTPPSNGFQRVAPTPRPGPSAWQQEAERWLGTPYKYGGTTRQGIDCSAFAREMQLRVAGKKLPRTTREQLRVGEGVGRRDLRPGDMVFFNTTGAGVSHVGVMIDGEQFVHASTSRGVTYSRLGEDYWTRRYLGARRIR